MGKWVLYFILASVCFSILLIPNMVEAKSLVARYQSNYFTISDFDMDTVIQKALENGYEVCVDNDISLDNEPICYGNYTVDSSQDAEKHLGFNRFINNKTYGFGIGQVLFNGDVRVSVSVSNIPYGNDEATLRVLIYSNDVPYVDSVGLMTGELNKMGIQVLTPISVMPASMSQLSGIPVVGSVIPVVFNPIFIVVVILVIVLIVYYKKKK